MTFGEKLRAARIFRGLTQAALCGDTITRNMLSQLEGDRANPSLSTLKYLAARLELPPGYFIDEMSEFDAKKIGNIQKIHRLLSEKKFADCLTLCMSLGSEDECRGDSEIALAIAECGYRLGREAFDAGDFTTARTMLCDALKYGGATAYDTTLFTTSARLMLDAIDRVTANESTEPLDLTSVADFVYSVDLWQSDDAASSRQRDYRQAIAEFESGDYEAAKNRIWAMAESTESLPGKYRLYSQLEKYSSKESDYETAYRCAGAMLEIKSKIK